MKNLDFKTSFLTKVFLTQRLVLVPRARRGCGGNITAGVMT